MGRAAARRIAPAVAALWLVLAAGCSSLLPKGIRGTYALDATEAPGLDSFTTSDAYSVELETDGIQTNLPGTPNRGYYIDFWRSDAVKFEEVGAKLAWRLSGVGNVGTINSALELRAGHMWLREGWIDQASAAAGDGVPDVLRWEAQGVWSYGFVLRALQGYRDASHFVHMFISVKQFAPQAQRQHRGPAPAVEQDRFRLVGIRAGFGLGYLF